MSSREKNLLAAFLLILVVAAVLVLYKQVYQPAYESAQLKSADAQQKIMEVELNVKTNVAFQEENDWITKYEPAPMTLQNALGALQTLCAKEATRNGLETKKENYLPELDYNGTHYQRVRYEMIVAGPEQNFYTWLTTLDNKYYFQRVTSITVYANKADDKQIEGKVVIEKWFTPSVN